jgi:hypothetical protein
MLGQSAIQQPLDIGAIAYARRAGCEGIPGLVSNRHHAAFRNDRNRATQVSGSEILQGGVGRDRVIGDLAMQRITGFITVSLSETDDARSVHRDVTKTDHRTPFEIRYEGPSMIPNWVSLFPPVAFVILA